MENDTKNEGLTLENVLESLSALPKIEPDKPLVVKRSALLNGTRVVVKIGNEVTLPKELPPGEYKFIEMPTYIEHL